MDYTRIIVSGRVHGVFYRASTKEIADQLNLKGYVRNVPDGTVEIVVRGEKVDQLITWCHKGPRLSIVKQVKTEIIELEEELSSFEIRY